MSANTGDAETPDPLYISGWNLKCYRCSEKQLDCFLKINMQLLHDPASAILGTCQRKKVTIYVHTKTNIWIFIVAVFIITKYWGKYRC